MVWRKSSLQNKKTKVYLNPKLDFEIRIRRTLHEPIFSTKVREAGVSTPLIYFVDPAIAEIVMQYIPGKRVKDILITNTHFDFICKELGRNIAKLHSKQLIHGDLTTSNFILLESQKIAFIDFGLSFYSNRLEDKAVDLHLIKEVLTSAHSQVAKGAFKSILIGYEEILGSNRLYDIVAKISEIEERGRYARPN